jgi:hypothetical protein
MHGATPALRGDDVEDLAERMMRDEERQLLVDVQRRTPDRRPGEPDREQCGGEGRRNQDCAAGALVQPA